MFRSIMVSIALVILAGCGIQQGDRFGGGSCPFKQIIFNSDGKVLVEGDKGSTWGTYTVDGDRVTIKTSGGISAFKHEGERLKCIPEWGGFYCQLLKDPNPSKDRLLLGAAAFALLTGAAIGLFWVSRRRFYRTNSAGIQEFSSHGKAVLSTITEGFVYIISILAMLLGTIFLIGFVLGK